MHINQNDPPERLLGDNIYSTDGSPWIWLSSPLGGSNAAGIIIRSGALYPYAGHWAKDAQFKQRPVLYLINL